MLERLGKTFRAALFAGLPLFIWSACAVAGPEAGTTAATVSTGHEWKGSVSQQKEEFIQVVTTPEEWAALWKRALDQPAPAVDFEHHAVACVFLGYSATWLFSIVFEGPQVRGETLVIPYGLVEMVLELSGPFKAGGQYAMKVFEKRKGCRMVLEKSTHERKRIRR